MHNLSKLFFFLLLPLSVTSGIAQVIYPPGYINMNTQAGGLVVPVNYASKSANDQEQYIDDRWNEGTIVLLTNDSIHRYPLKYNLVTDVVEVKTERAVKVVPLKDTQRFYWVDDGQRSEFINGSGYTMGGTPLVGYLQLLSEGPLNLFKKTFLSVQRANYRPELDVGNRDDKIVREDVYYVARGQHIVEIKPRRVFKFFKQHQTEVRKYAKQNRLRPQEEADLVAIVDYYNQVAQ